MNWRLFFKKKSTYLLLYATQERGEMMIFNQVFEKELM